MTQGGPSWRQIWIDLLLYPTHTLPTAAAPVAVGVGLAIRDHRLMALPALIAFLASWLVHVGGVLVDNDQLVFDHPDVPEHPELLHGVASGSLTRRRLRLVIAGCYGAAIIIGAWLLPVAGAAAVILGALGIAASLAYAAGPWPLARHGLADPVFFLMFGIVAVVGTYYVQAVAAHGATPFWPPLAEALPADAFILGLPSGALVTSVLVIDDIRDWRYDMAKGWRTPTVRFGHRWSRGEFVLLQMFGYVMPIWFWLGRGFSGWILLPLLTLPQATAVARTVWTREERDALVPMTPRTSMLALAYSLLLAVGIALS